MARRRTQSEATCREDAAIANSLATIADQLAKRHPDIIALKMAAKLSVDAREDLFHAANALAAKTPASAGPLIDG